MKNMLKLSFLTTMFMIVTACVATVAGAHEFEASKLGAMSAKGGVQVFTTEDGAVECAEADAGGEAGALKTVTLELALELKECLAFMLFEPMLLPKPLKIVFSANEVLTIKLLVVKLEFLGCEVNFPEQGPLKIVRYKNVGEKVEFDIEAKELTYTASAGCPKPGTFKDGTYDGKITDEVIGGKFSWK